MVSPLESLTAVRAVYRSFHRATLSVGRIHLSDVADRADARSSPGARNPDDDDLNSVHGISEPAVEDIDSTVAKSLPGSARLFSRRLQVRYAIRYRRTSKPLLSR